MANNLAPSNMPMQELRAGQIMPNSPQVGGSSPRMPAPPARFDRATAPVLNPGNMGGNLGSDFRMPQMPQKRIGLGGLLPQQNLDFLNKLPQNMMPNLDFSNLPQGLPSMEEIQGNRRMPQMRMGEMQPRVMMAAGGPLMGRAANLSRQVLNKNRMGRDLPGRATSNIGDMVMSGRAASPLTDSLRRGTEDFIMGATAGGTLGAAAIGLDGTQTLREPFSKDNVSFMSPEAFGKDMAQLRMDVDSVINLAKNKANEIGADINEYVGRAKQSYEQEMENKRMQEIEAQQGLQNVSLLFNQGGEAMKRYANGGEIENMLSGMDSGEQEAMGELEQMAPEMEMIDQLVMMVVQMIEQGASEEQVISFLREQGLDDEDIGTVFQLVSEMAETEEVAAQNEIGADLEQLG